MNYYISDLHLFHEASIKYDNRPFSTLEEMHSAINYTPRTLEEIMDRNEKILPE